MALHLLRSHTRDRFRQDRASSQGDLCRQGNAPVSRAGTQVIAGGSPHAENELHLGPVERGCAFNRPFPRGRISEVEPSVFDGLWLLCVPPQNSPRGVEPKKLDEGLLLRRRLERPDDPATRSDPFQTAAHVKPARADRAQGGGCRSAIAGFFHLERPWRAATVQRDDHEAKRQRHQSPDVEESSLHTVMLPPPWGPDGEQLLTAGTPRGGKVRCELATRSKEEAWRSKRSKRRCWEQQTKQQENGIRWRRQGLLGPEHR
jgi:hypothetical protein